jgi:hypothetical protein
MAALELMIDHRHHLDEFDQLVAAATRGCAQFASFSLD